MNAVEKADESVDSTPKPNNHNDSQKKPGTAVGVSGRMDMRNHFLSKQPTDFKIICNNEVGDSQGDFDVHAIVLQKYPVFDAMLQANLTEQTEKQLLISGWNRQVVEKFIEFLYNDRVDDIEQIVDDLLTLANMYMVLPLKEICGDAIVPRLAQDPRMIGVFDLAVKYDVKSLKLACHTQLPAKVGTFTVDQLCHILRNGQELHVLADKCEKQLISMIKADNVFDLLALAQEKSCAALYNEAALYVGKNWVGLSSTHRNEIADLSSSQLRFIVGQLSIATPPPPPYSGAPKSLFANRTCSSCRQTYQPGTKCGCGTVKCTGCFHAAHGAVCSAGSNTPNTRSAVCSAGYTLDIGSGVRPKDDFDDYGHASTRCTCGTRYTNDMFSILK